jgi:sulfur-carrier protein adenylyltransferase/sulfurtransferase
VNDAAVLVGKPVVHGSIFQFEGQVSVFTPPAGPCYRCLYPTTPPPGLVPSCSEVGVLGVLPGVIGVIQATETIKLLIGQGKLLVGRLLMYDALAMRLESVKIPGARRTKLYWFQDEKVFQNLMVRTEIGYVHITGGSGGRREMRLL